MKKLLLVIVVVGVIIAGILFLFKTAFTPGGGGSTQTAPDTVKIGELATVNLDLNVWGSGGSIKGRYTNIFLYYQITGQDFVKQIEPKLISQNNSHESYEFSIPTYPQYKNGEIIYSIELKLDGQPSRIEGIKKIQII